MKVLIADDELRLRKIVSMFLKKNDFDVMEASSAEQAIDMLGKTEELPLIIIFDISMPGIGGLEGCRIIKEDDRLKNIPVIILSANLGMEDKRKATEYGAAEYITKPFSPKELLEKIVHHSAKVTK